MNSSKAIVAIAMFATCVCASLVNGQEFAQSYYMQEPFSQPPVSLMSCEQCQPISDDFCGGAYGSGGGGGLDWRDCLSGFSVGGWAQMGYHSKDRQLSFNQHADRANLHQLWMHVEKDATAAEGFGWGGRVDYVYGVDAQDTQAFGINNNHWDNDWDNGIYGTAMPQAYGEVAYGDSSIKFGHFYTIIGYEVVTAPDNFFYSHAYTMINSEPFTHTGALFTHNQGEYITMWAGYSAGWDSGFEDNGDAVLAGTSLVLTDFLTFTYTGVYGRFGEQNAIFTQERGQMHSFVTSLELGDFNYVMQIDLLDTNDHQATLVRDTLAVNNYLLYQLMDEVSAGVRFEWYNVANSQTDSYDIYDLTFGLNIRPCDCVTVRPEVRWDWDRDINSPRILEANQLTGAARNNQMTFGIDAIVGF